MSRSKSPSWRKEVIQVKSGSEEKENEERPRVKFTEQRRSHENKEGNQRQSALRKTASPPHGELSSGTPQAPETPSRELGPRAVALKSDHPSKGNPEASQKSPAKGQGAKGKEKGKGKGKWQVWKSKKKKRKWQSNQG